MNEQCGGDAPCAGRRLGGGRPRPGRHRLPCIRPAGHEDDHGDTLNATWPPDGMPESEAAPAPRPVRVHPPVGVTAWDAVRDRVGVVTGCAGPCVRLWPLGGGMEWDAAPASLAASVTFLDPPRQGGAR